MYIYICTYLSWFNHHFLHYNDHQLDSIGYPPFFGTTYDHPKLSCLLVGCRLFSIESPSWCPWLLPAPLRGNGDSLLPEPLDTTRIFVDGGLNAAPKLDMELQTGGLEEVFLLAIVRSHMKFRRCTWSTINPNHWFIGMGRI